MSGLGNIMCHFTFAGLFFITQKSSEAKVATPPFFNFLFFFEIKTSVKLFKIHIELVF